MYRCIVILSLALPLVACEGASAPQSASAPATEQATAETAESLVKKHLAACGGEARLRSAKSMKFTAKGDAGELQLLTVYSQRPNQFRKEFTKDGKTFVKVFDGSAGFTIEDSKVTILPDDKIAMMRQHADFDDSLLDYNAKGHKVVLTGIEEVRGVKAHVLRLTLKSGEEENRYLDASTYLEIKRVVRYEHDGKKEEKTMYFSDYRSVDGIKLNHVIETEGGGKTSKLVVQEAWFDRPIDTALFRRPES